MISFLAIYNPIFNHDEPKTVRITFDILELEDKSEPAVWAHAAAVALREEGWAHVLAGIAREA